ncbi:MAG: hypothetical protein H6994_20060 [Pseudomonadales bacterium]|nr:hypothetical protein [Pseudomonadales bacterium]
MLVTLAENAKLLVAGPLLAGACMLGIAYLLPQTYVSEAVLQADQTMAGMMTTAPVLDAVIAKMGLDEGENPNDARRKLRRRIDMAIGRADKLLTVHVSAATPQLAKATADLLIEQTYQVTRPRGSIKSRLEAQLAEAQLRLKNGQESANLLLGRVAANGTEPAAENGIARSFAYADLLTVIAAAQTQISVLEAQLEGLSEALLVQPPTLPSQPVSPKKVRLTIAAIVIVEILLLMFVFGREALRNAAADPSAAEKLARIRGALGRKADPVER